MPTPSFYPNLATLVAVEDFPENLQFIAQGLESLLQNVYYKDLQFVKSGDNSKGYFDINIVVNQNLSINLFNTGFELVLNPGNSSESIIPIQLHYSWPILGLIANFKSEGFSFLAEEMQHIFFDTINKDDLELLTISVQIFEENADTAGLNSFISKVNTAYNLSGSDMITSPVSGDFITMSDDVSRQIGSNVLIAESFSKVVNKTYVRSADSVQSEKNLDLLAKAFSDFSIRDYIKNLIIPKISASLELSAGLTFPRNILLPVTDTGEIIPDPEKATLIFDIGKFKYSSSDAFGFEKEMSVSLNHNCQIGKTGLGISLERAKLDLSRQTNIDEANADGRSPDFIGVYFQKIAVTLPAKWFHEIDQTTAKISGYNILAGTGGLSGTIVLEALGGDNTLWAKIGSWQLGFREFDISFHQNSIVSSNLRASLVIPRFKSGNNPLSIDLIGHLYESGDFSLTAFPIGGVQADLFNFVNFNFQSFELGREGNNFFIGTACEIWFENPIMARLFDHRSITLPHLRIYSNGHIEITGGPSFIPLNIVLHLGPIDINVTGVYFGSYEAPISGTTQGRKYNYWGFDGSINIDPLGIDGKGKGVKYYYTIDNDEFGGVGDSFIRIQSIEIDLVIPGTASPDDAVAIIKGMVSVSNPGQSTEYSGSLTLKMPRFNICGKAEFKLQPKYPAFILDGSIQLPKAIPLGPVGIYEFRGLIGYRYVAEKEAIGLVSGVDSWYDYYKHPERGIHVPKFSGPEKTKNYSFPFSLGAGASVATDFDSGHVLSLRAMVLLSIPTLFLIEGKANVLAKRLSLADTTEPPFFAFVAWGDHSIEMGLGADYRLPKESGDIIKLNADVQAGFFFNNSSRWYVDFGTKDNPITSRVLDLVTAKAYLMLSSKGIEAGARVEFDLRKHFGPAKVHIYAYLEIGGHISFERPQIGGYLALGGMVDIEIWVVGVSIALDTILSVEAAKPYLLYAELRLKVCVRLGVKICKKFTVSIKWEKNTEVDRSAIPPLSYTDANPSQPDRSNELVKGINMLTNEAFDLDTIAVSDSGAVNIDPSSITHIIPCDTYIDIRTTKGLIPTTLDLKIGGHTSPAANYTDLVSPESTSRSGRQLRQVKHTYSIEAIELKAWSGSQWIDYHPYQAIIEGEDVTSLRIGYWQRSGEQYDTIRLLATNPFSFTEQGEPGWFIPEQYGINPSTLFCIAKQESPHCSNVLNIPINTIYYPPTQYVAHFINGAYYTLLNDPAFVPSLQTVPGLSGNNMKVTDAANNFGFTKSLSFNNYNSLVIYLPDPSVQISLMLSTNAAGVTINYYEKIIDDTVAEPQYNPLDNIYKLKPELSHSVDYDAGSAQVSKIVITPDDPNGAAILDIMEQIADLFDVTYTNGSGSATITEPDDVNTYNTLLAELDELQNTGCSANTGNTFSHYFGTSNSDINYFRATHICRLDGNYVIAVEYGSINNPEGLHASILFKINSSGQILSEAKVGGLITDMKVVNSELLITAAEQQGIDKPLETPILLKLDAELVELKAVVLKDVVKRKYNQLCLLPGSNYSLWIASNYNDPGSESSAFQNGTRIILFNNDTLELIDTVKIKSVVAIKTIVNDGNSFMFIASPSTDKESTIVKCEIDQDNNINVLSAQQFVDHFADIAILQSGEIVVTGRKDSDYNKQFFGMVNSDDIDTYASTQFDPAGLKFGMNSLQNGDVSILAYSESNIYSLDTDNSMSILGAKTENTGLGNTIRYLTNNSETAEVYILSDDGGENNVVISILDETLSSCLLDDFSINPMYDADSIELTERAIDWDHESTDNEESHDLVSASRYIDTINTVCPLIPTSGGPVQCITSLQQICWLTIEQSEYNSTIPGQGDIAQDQAAMVLAMQKTAQPIWRPDTKYYVHFTLKDTVDNGHSAPGVYDYYYGFKTVGPLGHYDKDPLVNYVPVNANRDEYPLAILANYIDYNRSYPNADGNLLQSKPLFYGHDQCKITLFFTKACVYHMMQNWHDYNGLPALSGEMHITIKDPVSDVIVPYPLPIGYNEETVPVPDGSNVWTGDNDPRIPLNIQILNNMINYVNSTSNAIQCQLTIGSPIVPAAYSYSVTLTNLAPSKLYTAIIFNAFKAIGALETKTEEIHKFVFQTSRYQNFAEQVNSYILTDENGGQQNAVFYRSFNIGTSDVNTIYNIAAGNPDPGSDALETKYIDPFDRVFEGILGMKPDDPSQTTDFTVLRIEGQDNGFAIIIGNPEPFNNPKLAGTDLSDTITVVNGGGVLGSQFRILHSKDRRRALIIRANGSLVPLMNFRFRYKTWNGSLYTVADTVLTSSIQINPLSSN